MFVNAEKKERSRFPVDLHLRGSGAIKHPHGGRNRICSNRTGIKNARSNSIWRAFTRLSVCKSMQTYRLFLSLQAKCSYFHQNS